MNFQCVRISVSLSAAMVVAAAVATTTTARNGPVRAAECNISSKQNPARPQLKPNGREFQIATLSIGHTRGLAILCTAEKERRRRQSSTNKRGEISTHTTVFASIRVVRMAKRSSPVSARVVCIGKSWKVGVRLV